MIQNIITELAESDLERVIAKRTNTQQPFTTSEFKKAAHEIILGISQMHAKKICHRDLKPENILVINGVCKIGDFGSAKTNFQPNTTNTPYCVSRYYRAPELILGLKEYNMTIDVWSYGVILLEMLALNVPWKGKTEGQQLIEYLKTFGSQEAKVWNHWEE